MHTIFIIETFRRGVQFNRAFSSPLPFFFVLVFVGFSYFVRIPFLYFSSLEFVAMGVKYLLILIYTDSYSRTKFEPFVSIEYHYFRVEFWFFPFRFFLLACYLVCITISVADSCDFH
ncbi:LOW QUALITY PROTEIN: hypothetical protein TorRG33x02_088120 [Trema orientale]|uniref:Uncharacterized protein n=1 Tax=Trema orientale TaxID=63057 RepID=A0A2P5FBX8_TREOI|nr:LOW QUALITY PROTEIN: hypothetical protein TorRG33x02_088120 [Trema orientale]